MKHQHPNDNAYHDSPPEHYDGFGFFKDPEDGVIKFYYFDDVVKEHGLSPRDPNIPEDREAYHVLLSSIRKTVVHLDAPFISNFIDPFVYATNLAYAGFSGIMLKKTQWSANVIGNSMKYLRSLYANDRGCMYTDEDGTTTLFLSLKANT